MTSWHRLAGAAMARLPGRRRRRQATIAKVGLVVAGLVATALAIAGMAAWWLRRRDDSASVRGHTLDDAAFDATALDRAADEGMALAPAPDSDGEAVAGGGLVRVA